MGKKRIFSSPQEMEEKWEEYKYFCNNQEVMAHDFSSKNSEFVSAKLKKSITYTIEGFCVYCRISRQAFYKYYGSNKRYVDIVTRIREECEVDARMKFETGIIPSQLAGLWMSKYGYSTKQEVKDDTSQAKSVSNIENLCKQMAKVDDDDVAE